MDFSASSAFRSEDAAPIAPIKTIGRKWVNAAFASSMVSFVMMCVWVAAGFFYISSVLKPYGVEVGWDRMEMVFSDGSSLDMSKPEFFESEGEYPFTALQGEEFNTRYEQFESEYLEAKAWVTPAIVFGVTALVGAVLSLPLYIVLMMLIYKGWRSLRPLKAVAREETSLMPGPVTALVLCLVPVFNLLWAYICLPGYGFYGKKLAALKGVAYRGPSLALGLFIAIWLSFAAVHDTCGYLEVLPIPLLTDTVLSMFAGLVTAILLFLFCRRLSFMVEDFGANVSPAREGLPE